MAISYRPELTFGGSKFARFHVANHFLIQILHNMRYAYKQHFTTQVNECL